MSAPGRPPSGSSRLLVVAAVLALAARPVGAQEAPDIAGTWDVRWAQAVRVNRDLSVEVQGWGDAILQLEQDGSELSGTWTTEVRERISWSVTGSILGERVTLRATEHDSDDAELAIVESIEWTGSLTGGELHGHVMLRIGGRDREPARRPFTATRRGGG